MFKKSALLILVLVCLFPTFRDIFTVSKKTKLTPEESVEAINTLFYMNMLVASYSGCNLKAPPEPTVIRVKTGHIKEYCPKFAIACYKPVYNIIYYEEGDMPEFGHEYGHAILSHNTLAFDCVQELILQQRDIIRDYYGDNAVLNDKKRTK